MTGILGMAIMFIYGMLAYYTETLHTTLIGSNVSVIFIYQIKK